MRGDQKTGAARGAQLFTGAGRWSIIARVARGHSGGRQGPQNKHQTSSLLNAVAKDAALRGDADAFVARDINLEQEDNQARVHRMTQAGRHDAAKRGRGGFDATPTCLKGKESRVDWALVNETGAAPSVNMTVRPPEA